MKKIVLTIITVCLSAFTLLAQIPMGFNYQAVIRNSEGELITNQAVSIRISLIQGNETKTSVYTEEHSVTTNDFGLTSLKIGEGDPVTGDFQSIDWGLGQYFLEIEVDESGNTDYVSLGAFQLLSVPYAIYAKKSEELNNNVLYFADSEDSDTLFAVKNREGDIVFAVFNNGVKVYVDETNKGVIGAFAVSGRTSTKETKDIFVVTPEKTQVYVDETAKGVIGAFAVSGRTSTKETQDIFSVTPEKTQVYVDETTKGVIGAFAVSGRTSTKETQDIFSVTPEKTQVYVDETTKGVIGAFAVSGRTSTKETQDIFSVTPEKTQVYVDETAKGVIGAFAVSGRTSTKETNDIFSVTTEKTQVYVDETTKGVIGAFAVSGRTSTKETNDIFLVTPEKTQVYVDETTKGVIGAFAVSGRTSTKEDKDILLVTPEETQVYFDETSDQSINGFKVSGRTPNKAGETYDVFTVRQTRTNIYIKPDESKMFPDGFTISGLDNDLQTTELFSVSQEGTLINTELAVAPKVTTTDAIDITQISAVAGGNITDDGETEIIERGIVYSTSGTPSLDMDFASMDPSVGGISTDVNAGTGIYSVNIPVAGNLQPGTIYYYRAYAINAEELTGYGETKQFNTDDPSMLTFMIYDFNEKSIGSEANIILYPYGNIANPIINPTGDTIFYVGDGVHNYSVEVPGFESLEMQQVNVFGETFKDVYLEPEVPKYSVIFEVEKNEGGAAEGFNVELSINQIETTNASGIAEFSDVPEGESYQVNIYKDGDSESFYGDYDINDQSPYYDADSGNIIIPVQLNLAKK